MANDTTVTVVGNLTADPDLRFTPAGVALAKFTVASTPRVFDKGQRRVPRRRPAVSDLYGVAGVGRARGRVAAQGDSGGGGGPAAPSRWETDEGEKRSAYGLDVDELGPSLRFATANVRKMTRSGGTGHHPETVIPADDPWMTATPISQPAAA